LINNKNKIRCLNLKNLKPDYYSNGSGTQDAAKQQGGNAATRWPISVACRPSKVELHPTLGAFHLVTQVDTSIILSWLFIECQGR